jgi:hypothetical protein
MVDDIVRNMLSTNGVSGSSRSMTLGLDQVPESLFPAVACSAYLPLGPLDVALIVLVFFVGELATSRLFFAVGLRDRPY